MIAKFLAVCCAFTMLASGWLFTMYLILQHPGFQWRAVMALCLLAQAGATLAALWRRPAFPLRVVIVASAIAIAAFGAMTVIQNNMASNLHYEGFADLIGLALLVQGLLTLWWGLTPTPATPSRS